MSGNVPGQDGAAVELQRIEREFERQRDSLTAGTVRFDDWRAAWQTRQLEIDASLARLRETLGNALPDARRLKIVNR